MVSSVFNIAVSGLTTAQAGLSAISNNISNAGTAGYSRQDLVQTAAAGIQTRIGYLGAGVSLDDVRRASSDFLNGRLNEAVSKESYFRMFEEQISQIDTALSDDVNGVAAGLTGFFTAIQDLTTRPGDLAARESLITAAETVAGRINAVDNTLDSVRDSINGALLGAVDAVNGISRQLADLNIEIITVANGGGKTVTPNDLLDRRDMLMKELSEYVSTTVVKNNDGTLNIYLQSGQPLVSKSFASELTALRDVFNPETIDIGLKLKGSGGDGLTVRYDAQALGSGKIAGMLTMRDSDLPRFRNIMGVIAGQFAERINELQLQGYDLNGAPGVAMFEMAPSVASRSLENDSMATVSISKINFDKVKANDYEVLNDNGTIKFRMARTREPFEAATAIAPGKYMIGDEFEFSIAGDSVNGDRFLLQPVASAAQTMEVVLTGPSEIAAGRVQNARGDASNLQLMANLQTNVVEINAFGASQEVTLTSAFNQLVSRVGNRAREVKESLETSTAVRESAEAQQQDLSGVNLDEEAANLLKYQQAYQASGQVIAMSKDLFDSLLNAIN